MVSGGTSSTCPGRQLLGEFAAGNLSPEEATRLEDHLSHCPQCAAQLMESQQDEQLTAQLRQALGLQDLAARRQLLTKVFAGQYEILEAIGEGSSGIVFKARDIKLGRLVAIKSLADNRESGASAVQEARHFATINHPNIATIHSVCDDPQSPCIVMELADGVPITQAMMGLPVEQQLNAFLQLLEAVAQLHAWGLVHCDLKPANVLVDHQRHVKLVDPGIARKAGVGDGRFHGTPAYAAPEQLRGDAAAPTADVFALGIILFELLTGERPLAGRSIHETAADITTKNPPLPRSLRAEIPAAMQAICLTALEKDPHRRYASAKEFLLDLRRWQAGEAVVADPTLLTTVLEHGIERHVHDLRRWHQDRMISSREWDYFLDKYHRLRQREEAWVLDSRRISFSQVMLHLGVWACVVSGFLMLAFPWPNLSWPRPVLPGGLFAVLLGAGGILWQRRDRRVGLILLIGAAMILPIAVAVACVQYHWLIDPEPRQRLLGDYLGNRQLLAATAAWLALSLAIWRGTQTAAFAVVSTIAIAACFTAIFAMHDLRGKLADGDFAAVARWYLTPGVMFFAVGIFWDLLRKNASFAAPFYIAGLLLLLLSLSLIAYFGPTVQWLGLARAHDGTQLARLIDYSFMINGVIYLCFALIADRSPSSPWLRWIGGVLFWLAPTHLLLPVLRLEDQWPIAGSSWTIPELVLPVTALAFLFAAVPKQMKSLFFSGLFYLAISMQQLTARHFENKLGWPIGIAIAGMLLTVVAWQWPAVFESKHDR